MDSCMRMYIYKYMVKSEVSRLVACVQLDEGVLMSRWAALRDLSKGPVQTSVTDR